MKPLLSIAALMLFFTTYSFSQSIGIADFLQLRGKNNNVIESKLTSLNIQLYDQDEQGSGKTHYTYQNNNTSENSFQYVDFVYAQDEQWNNRLSFQVQNIELVKKFLTQMKDLGFYFDNKKVVDRQIYEVYTDGMNTIELITSQSRSAYDNNHTEMFFNFVFYNTDEYQYAFANENKIYSVPQIDQNNLFADLVGFSISSSK